jgi:FkbM family methyltransferase
MKEVLRQLCPPIVWNALRRVAGRGAAPGPVRGGTRYHGLQELDRKLERHLDFDGGFFIEVGGWDGLTMSNSLYFEQSRNWRGMLIEPAPNEFLACRANRPDAIVVCRACVPFGYPERFLPMTYCASMTAARSSSHARNRLEDLDRHLASGVKFLQAEQTVFEFAAPASPLSAILDEQAITVPIDLLILDVEGFEICVLEGLDFARHAPRFICVEARGREEIETFLGARGYRLVEQLTFMEDCQDYLFART